MSNDQFKSLNNSSLAKSDFDLGKEVKKYTQHWPWFLLSIIIFVGGAFLYLRYTIPQYGATATLIITNEEESPLSGIAQFEGFAGEEKSVENEIRRFKSRGVMRRVVRELGLNTQYFAQGRVNEIELYPKAPVKAAIIASDSLVERAYLNFNVTVVSETNFKFEIIGSNKSKTYAFGQNIPTRYGDLLITPDSDDLTRFKGETYRVTFLPVDAVAVSLINRLSIVPIKGSDVISLFLSDASKRKAIDVINEVISQYAETSFDEKKAISKVTTDFINNRLEIITNDLSDVDESVERFKSGNQLTNISSEAELFLNTGSEYRRDLLATGTQLTLVESMSELLDNQQAYELLPSNIGLEDATISAATASYNELISERNRLLKSSSEKNPVIVNLDQRINEIRRGLQQSLNNAKNSLNIRVGDLRRQTATINSKISTLPGQERQFLDISRQQQIYESLYLYLLEKREEAAITQAAISPNTKVIDEAFAVSESPISPNKKMIYLVGIFLGLVTPFSFFYLRNLLDNKIHNKEDLEKELNISILGEIPRLKGKNKTLLVERNDRSILSESFRIIRTNFDYLKRVRNTHRYDNVIFVTSTVNGEGKTFVSTNLSLIMANSDKRVLLIGADIRNPKIQLFLKKQKRINNYGLTDYLFDRSLTTKDVISTYEIKNNHVDILLSGKTPPNPAEMLMSERMRSLFDEVSMQYDYVIVDTAPAMLVTDTLLFSQYAGHTIYVTRAEYTEKRILNFARELYEDKKLNGMMLVVNDVKQSNFGYGAKYGYGYYDNNKKKGKKSALKKTAVY
ncbi:polysaccharide biosynthesis tyrosine autokinase [Leptobacterium flavescens]|uniref:non-specific protein-tyrosine kinase n=1 Tax=Leptobacterium flavescens TaxID=472055 RepID=A0A6P0UU65_9FLAO|nr:tyrosine-protein kinase [Leptobacterium flavescens]NER13966.1 polysaccharide biosynthesis tyrosine autokinase [Leptobacterium flavescens]